MFDLLTGRVLRMFFQPLPSVRGATNNVLRLLRLQIPNTSLFLLFYTAQGTAN